MNNTLTTKTEKTSVPAATAVSVPAEATVAFATASVIIPASEIGGSGARLVRRVFRLLQRLLAVGMLLPLAYCLFASDRYVSEAIVLIQNTEAISMGTTTLSSMLGRGAGGLNPLDQILLREYLLSVDMLHKLDAAFNLRAHYSDSSRDLASRMWFEDASLEWFYRHHLSRTHVELDSMSGVLRIRVEAYDARTAHDIAAMLVAEGERFMNELSHNLAKAQVDFLNTQVDAAYTTVLQASQALLDFQNQEGLASPLATVESINRIIAGLESQRSNIQTQLASLPGTLTANHSTVAMLRQSLAAIERQIELERAKLASSTGDSLNALAAEEERLKLEVTFKQDVYKTALVALEQGRMDASRTIKKVSVLQTPTLPEYPWEPRRLYGLAATLCIYLMVAGIVKLLEGIILDHVD